MHKSQAKRISLFLKGAQVLDVFHRRSGSLPLIGILDVLFLAPAIKNSSRTPPRHQNLLQILAAVLMRGLVVVELLLKVGNFRSGLGALAGKTLVDSVDGDVDEPESRLISWDSQTTNYIPQ